jgi:hypothetical protein
MLDLTNLLHSLAGPISPFTYYDVNGINDRGQLLVLASNTNEDFHSFLLTPDGQPVPTTPTSPPIVVPVTVSPYTPPPAPVPEPSLLAFFVVIIAASACRQLLQRSKQ